MMRPYVPENADVVYVDGARHGEELLTLLKDEKGSVLIVNGAVLPVGVFSGGAVYSADAKECCKVLKEHGAFAAFPKGAEITKGFLPVGDDEELRSAQDMCRRKIADKHFAAAFPSWTPTIPTLTPRQDRQRHGHPAGNDPARPDRHRQKLHHRPERHDPRLHGRRRDRGERLAAQ